MTPRRLDNVALPHHHCATCRYELTGLARRGACPECGAAYDMDSGQGMTSGEPTRAPFDAWGLLRTMTAVTLLWLFACVAANLVGGGVSWTGGTLILLALLLIIGGIWTARTVRRAKAPG